MLAMPTRIHGMFDYTAGALAIASPWLFGFSAETRPMAVAVGAGILVIVYALLTDYEMGAARSLQIPVHLWLDGILGLLLAISPWLFGFDQTVWIPHLLLGLVLIFLAVFSQTIPGYERRRARN